MDKLLNLVDYKKQLSDMISQSDLSDYELPIEFKNSFKSFGEYKVEEYYKYTIKVSSRKSVCYIPNQWIYIAAICSEYCIELKKYKQKLKSLGITDDDFEACHPSTSDKSVTDEQRSDAYVSQKAAELLSSYTGEDKDLLISFLWDYDSWGGGKNIKRDNDFTISPCLNVANSINSSSSLIGDIAKSIGDNPSLFNSIINSPEMGKILRGKLETRNPLVRVKTAAGFLREALKVTLSRDKDFSLLEGTGKYTTTDKSLFINGYWLGRDKNQMPSRGSDVYKEVEWAYGNKKYVLNLEMTPDALKSNFFPVFNDAYRNRLYMENDAASGDFVLYEINGSLDSAIKNSSNQPLQQIFYGAPGTGKSFTIDKETKNKSVIRTTFHPDSDYSTFVGAYKPTMESAENRVVPVVFNNGISLDQNKGTYTESKITYKFVKQAFLKAYLAAWKKYAEAQQNGFTQQYLVIEEINRGNCAQIFGDIFQLLDRQDNGFSAYPIEADTDIQNAIKTAFEEEKEYKLGCKIDVDFAVENYTSNYDADTTLSEDVQAGRVMLLPPNLYIWATMNTSDQSLFPIDSAFKRRWDWVYIPIKDHEEEGYKIDIDGAIYSWWGFLEKINNVIGQVTSSEDKKLGYFFVKALDKVVDANKFVGKVLFYLWNDVFKNYGFENAIFSRAENKKFEFSDFFKKDGSPDTEVVNEFMKKLNETIDKDNSFVIQDSGSSPSSLIIRHNGESIEGDSAVSKYIEFINRVIKEKDVNEVADCLGADMTQTPPDNTTRKFRQIGDSGWYLATNIGTGVMKDKIYEIKKLGVDVVIE